jgi:hypothetical protein
VGIGAYLVRLGQRTIQMVNGPLILTGYSALNKLLGREVSILLLFFFKKEKKTESPHVLVGVWWCLCVCVCGGLCSRGGRWTTADPIVSSN